MSLLFDEQSLTAHDGVVSLKERHMTRSCPLA